MKNLNQRIVLTKRMLREGLLRLLETKTLDKINITELCRESGINRATFYRHYDLPRDILTEMQEEFTEELFAQFKNPLTEREIERFFTYFSQNADLVRIFIRYNSYDDLLRMFSRFYQSVLDQDLTYTEKIKEFDSQSQKLLCTYLAGGAYFLLRQWLMEEIPKTPKEIAAIALSIIDKEYVC